MGHLVEWRTWINCKLNQPERQIEASQFGRSNRSQLERCLPS